jgi:hypothetical protein
VSSLYSGIIPIIKKAAIDAVDSTQPVQFVFGTVISVSPLKIQVTPKLTLGKGNLALSGTLTKHSVRVTVKGETESADDHKHDISIPVTVTIDNSLKTGDSVILARMQGGNKYLVLDKAVDV